MIDLDALLWRFCQLRVPKEQNKSSVLSGSSLSTIIIFSHIDFGMSPLLLSGWWL